MVTLPPIKVPPVVRRAAAAARRPADIACSGIVVVVAAVQVALMGAPVVGVELVAAGLYVGLRAGLRAGASWRQALREERDNARARVEAWNSSAVRDDLATVGPATEVQPCTCNIPGGDSTPDVAVERYDAEREEGFPLCSWCEKPATTRIDIPGLSNAPTCPEHHTAARFGEVTADNAYPDTAATYDRRLG